MFFLSFRNECEELRSELSKRTRDEIFSDRNEQIKIKRDQLTRDAETEQFYADVWEQDRLSKAHREEIETQQQFERNHSALEVYIIKKEIAHWTIWNIETNGDNLLSSLLMKILKWLKITILQIDFEW